MLCHNNAVERLQGRAIIFYFGYLPLDILFLNAAKIPQNQETTKKTTSINKRLTFQWVQRSGVALLIAPANDWLLVLIVVYWIAQEVGEIAQITLSVALFCGWWVIARNAAKKRLQAKISALSVCSLLSRPPMSFTKESFWRSGVLVRKIAKKLIPYI